MTMHLLAWVIMFCLIDSTIMLNVIQIRMTDRAKSLESNN